MCYRNNFHTGRCSCSYFRLGKFANGAATAAFASIVAEGAAATSRRNSFDPISADVPVADANPPEIALNVDAELTGSPYSVRGPGNVPAYSRSGIVEEVVVRAQYTGAKLPAFNVFTGHLFTSSPRSTGAAATQAIQGGAMMLGAGAVGGICVASGGSCAAYGGIGFFSGEAWNLVRGNPFGQGALYNTAWGVVTGPLSPMVAGAGPISRAAWEARFFGLGAAGGEMIGQ